MPPETSHQEQFRKSSPTRHGHNLSPRSLPARQNGHKPPETSHQEQFRESPPTQHDPNLSPRGTLARDQ
ncbi:hypothetical protein BCAL_1441 [Bifidobacterium callitrichos DSM 23973]|uniref:Uncharacterized protein n=1 Tax=Bifidobacterium callitrichos DSM 23973 TaxID=1437609 RepID=A0A087A6V5_9BIFI|nr:hypothetical protein BCAL_1441 [Bifidobacterium callitrichos DSM 23973]